ncbi:MAG TPA: hypothetical protein DCE56_03960 [Cyanobacteria bacterium UBA8553]|nr:hypothetical protein [Cyanobacteria bacterium UBA8553]
MIWAASSHSAGNDRKLPEFNVTNCKEKHLPQRLRKDYWKLFTVTFGNLKRDLTFKSVYVTKLNQGIDNVDIC